MINEVFVSNKIQQIKWSKVPSHRVNSVTIKFNFSEEWKDLLCVALFKQDGVCIPQLINEKDECLLPVELKAGTVVMSVFGNKQDGSAYRETAIKSEFTIYDSGYCEDMTPPVPPTPDLYEQLLKRFGDMVKVDQIYNALSENAQSGKAVAEAVKSGVENANNYTDEQIAKISLTADHSKLINRNLPNQHTIGSITDLQEELDKAIRTTLNVEIEDDGFGGYRADHKDSEINNHRNAGGIVQAKYYNQAENQTYTYYYSTMESDRKPTFIRTFINADGKTEQVLASVGNDKKVSVERRVSGGGGFVAQDTEPTNKDVLWIDTADGGYVNGNEVAF